MVHNSTGLPFKWSFHSTFQLSIAKRVKQKVNIKLLQKTNSRELSDFVFCFYVAVVAMIMFSINSGVDGVWVSLPP